MYKFAGDIFEMVAVISCDSIRPTIKQTTNLLLENVLHFLNSILILAA